MRLILFFAISISLHGLLLALPAPGRRMGGAHAIPVTLRLDTGQATKKLVTFTAPTQRPARGKKRAVPTKPRKARRNKKLRSSLVVNKHPRAPRRHVTKPPPPQEKDLQKPVREKKVPDVVQTVSIPAPSYAEPMVATAASPGAFHPRAPNLSPKNEPRDETAPPPFAHATAVPDTVHGPGTGTAERSHARAPAAARPGKAKSVGTGDREALFAPAAYAMVTKPDYPRRARSLGWEGTTLLRVLVDGNGQCKKVEVSQSSGFAELDWAAARAVKKWRFHPARSGHTAVESWVKVPVVFDLRDSDSSSLPGER